MDNMKIIKIGDGYYCCTDEKIVISKLFKDCCIKNKVKKNSLIDLEVGAYSRPLTSSEKRAYGLI